MGSSLAWVSAHSASGSEPATMPAPATRRARRPSMLGAAQRDGPLAVAARRRPSRPGRRSAAGSAFEREDHLERRVGGRAADGGGGVQRARTSVERVRRGSRSVPYTGVGEVGDVGRTSRPRVRRARIEVARTTARVPRRSRRRRSGARCRPWPTRRASASVLRRRSRRCRRAAVTRRVGPCARDEQLRARTDDAVGRVHEAAGLLVAQAGEHRSHVEVLVGLDVDGAREHDLRRA